MGAPLHSPASAAPVDFLSPVSIVEGFGARRTAAMKESGIETAGDLLTHFPRRYLDRSNVVPLGQVSSFLNAACTVCGIVEKVRVERGRRSRLRVLLSDGTGSIELLWFAGIPIFQKTLVLGARILATGTVKAYRHLQMAHPLIERLSDKSGAQPRPFVALYPITDAMRDAGIGHRLLSQAIGRTLAAVQRWPRLLPERIEKKHGFPPLEQCLRTVHFPTDPAMLDICRKRLRYEELYRLALTLHWSRRKFALPGRSMLPGDLPDRFRRTLPFALTAEQGKAIRLLLDDAASGRRMHRLLQGDVGCGKTLAALFACFPALASGLQVAWLAPTEVLALQTFKLMNTWLAPLGFTPGLLKGGISTEERRAVLNGCSSGTLRFAVGTHALLQPSVRFKALGMIVIDEQHKFGAEQRLIMQEKDPASDFLLMSATPIPQTLAKTLYNDLDIVTINSLPPGRTPVATHLVPPERRDDMEQFVRRAIAEEGRAAYWVVPRIDEDETLETLKDAGTVFKELSAGAFAGIPGGCMHGRMSSSDKERVMTDFVTGSLKLLVSTTVIEVGVDVPAATIMVIENPERFGVAQLHQLRGRVGRGVEKSYCFLMTHPGIDEAGMRRLSFFCGHHDGFAIAEMDLSLRGPGEVAGFRQTGWDDLKLTDIVADAPLFREIIEEIETNALSRSNAVR